MGAALTDCIQQGLQEGVLQRAQRRSIGPSYGGQLGDPLLLKPTCGSKKGGEYAYQ